MTQDGSCAKIAERSRSSSAASGSATDRTTVVSENGDCAWLFGF